MCDKFASGDDWIAAGTRLLALKTNTHNIERSDCKLRVSYAVVRSKHDASSIPTRDVKMLPAVAEMILIIASLMGSATFAALLSLVVIVEVTGDLASCLPSTSASTLVFPIKRMLACSAE